MTKSEKISEIDFHLVYIQQHEKAIEDRNALPSDGSLECGCKRMADNMADSVCIAMAQSRINIIRSQRT